MSTSTSVRATSYRFQTSADIHEDMEPQYIFFKEGIQEQWLAFKLLVLGDFGLFGILDCEVFHRTAGTKDFRAPEHFGPFPAIAITTDIYLIGLNIWSMVGRQRIGVKVEKKIHQRQLQAFLEEMESTTSYDALYSSALEGLVKRCMNPNPLDCILIPLLLQEVTRGREANTKTTPNRIFPKDREMHDLPEWDRVIFRENAFQFSGPVTATKVRSGDWETTLDEVSV
jgi:hypothetical protein